MLVKRFAPSQKQSKKARLAIRADLETGIQHLTKLFRIMDSEEHGEQPVAFAANSLYVLARNGLAKTDTSKDIIETQLVPLLLSKQ